MDSISIVTTIRLELHQANDGDRMASVATQCTRALLLAVLVIMISGFMESCARNRPQYVISLGNAGSENISVTSLHWGSRQVVTDTQVGISLPGGPPEKFQMGSYSLSVGWPIPDRVQITWKPASAPEVTQVFELRSRVEMPDAFAEAVMLEISGTNLRVYVGKEDPFSDTGKRLIVDSIGAHN